MKDSQNIVPGVDITTVQTELAQWRTFNAQVLNGGQNSADIVNGYFIPIGDIQNVILGNATALGYTPTGVRAYFALRSPQNTPAEANLHLYIVAVDQNGNDVVEYTPPPTQNDPNPQPVSLVYDTTVPCPPTCGQSILMSNK